MGLFSKPTYEEHYLNYRVGQLEEDIEASCINMEPYGNFNGEDLYFFASYFVKGDMDTIKEAFTKVEKIKVTLKKVDDKIKDFKIDLKDLSEKTGFKQIEELELCGWGINKKQNL